MRRLNMTVPDVNIKDLIQERQLSQWHLMVASLLGSLASQQGMFNQAFLNRLLAHSMDNFVVPYFQSMPEYESAIQAIPAEGRLQHKLEPIVGFIDSVFTLAGSIEVVDMDEGVAGIKVRSSSCRFCPIGVGRAKLTEGSTFCPFPKMIEKTANAMLTAGSVVAVTKREGTRTHVLEKKDGSCYISFRDGGS